VVSGVAHLFSLYSDTEWGTAPVEAECLCQDAVTHACGIYAWRSAIRGVTTSSKIYGEIAMWGKIDVYTHGYKSEYAMLTAVCRTQHGLREDLVALQYGVPLVAW
jgi:hypothetical protein